MGLPTKYPCSICNKYFTDQTSHDQHTAEHVGIDRFRCPTCSREFQKQADLNSHKAKHVPRLCLECGKLFANSASLMIHMRSHSGVKPYSCPNCGKQFTQWVNFNRHKQLHSGIKSFVCSICSRAFARMASLKKHELVHSKKLPYCEICGKSFKVGSFARHMQMHSGECPICSVPLLDIKQYRYHMTRMHGSKRNECNRCPKKFNSYRKLIEHVRVHDEEQDFKEAIDCSQCKRMFKSVDKLKHHNCFVKEQHMSLQINENQSDNSKIEADSTSLEKTMIPTLDECLEALLVSNGYDVNSIKSIDGDDQSRLDKNQEKPLIFNVSPTVDLDILLPDKNQFKCDICSNSFEDYSIIKKHIHKEHITKPKFKCKNNQTSVCQKTKTNRHFANTNPTERLQCDICKHFIKNRRGMVHHMTIHMTPAFHCPVCSKSFTRSSILKLHLAVHTKERPYQCEKCAKKFTQLGDLKKHLRTHTGQHTIFCPHCARGFYDKSTYNRHISEVHSKNPPKPYPCPVCHRCFARANTRNTHLRVHRNDPTLPADVVIPNDSRRFVCEVCQKSFPMEAFLKRHMRKHSDERPFACTDCGLWYKQRQTLVKHVAAHHSGDKNTDALPKKDKES